MIYVKTALGRQALKERSEAMPRKYHFPFLMFDGTRDHVDVLAAEAKAGFTAADIEQMVRLGFIEPLTKTTPTPPTPTATTEQFAATAPISPTVNDAAKFVEAVHLATALTANLGLRGFRLNLAIERAGNLNELRALLPQIETAVGSEVIKPLSYLLSGK